MSFLNIFPIEIRIKTRLINNIHKVLYKSTQNYSVTYTQVYLTDLLHFKHNLESLRNSNTYLSNNYNYKYTDNTKQKIQKTIRRKIIQIFGRSYLEQSIIIVYY